MKFPNSDNSNVLKSSGPFQTLQPSLHPTLVNPALGSAGWLEKYANPKNLFFQTNF